MEGVSLVILLEIALVKQHKLDIEVLYHRWSIFEFVHHPINMRIHHWQQQEYTVLPYSIAKCLLI